MGQEEAAVQLGGDDGAHSPKPPGIGAASNSSLVARCTLTRVYQMAAYASLLSHQLGLASSEVVDAAKHLGLKAKIILYHLRSLGLGA